MDAAGVVAVIVLTDNANRELRHAGCADGAPVIGYVEVLRPHPVDIGSLLEYQSAVEAGARCSKCGQPFEAIGC